MHRGCRSVDDVAIEDDCCGVQGLQQAHKRTMRSGTRQSRPVMRVTANQHYAIWNFHMNTGRVTCDYFKAPHTFLPTDLFVSTLKVHNLSRFCTSSINRRSLSARSVINQAFAILSQVLCMATTNSAADCVLSRATHEPSS